MGLPVEVNNLMLGSLGGYTVGRSLRFRSSASAYLNRTPTTPTSATTFTWSGWVKRGQLGTVQPLFSATTGGTNTSMLFFDNTDTLGFYWSNGGGTLVTTAVFRDPSAWYHFVFYVSGTTQRIYVNNQLLASTTTGTSPTNLNTANPHYVGFQVATSRYFDGYLAEVNFIDGQALTPSSFGAYDTNGVWQPKKYTGTYGTNGFYLPFSNTTSTTTLVQDSSGNGNNWTPNNISLTAGTTYDSMIDSPTVGAGASNYAVLNPLDKNASSTLSNANLTSASGAASWYGVRSSFAVTSGKWYWEVTAVSLGASTSIMIGVADAAATLTYPGATTNGYGYYSDTSTGQKFNNSSGTIYGTAFVQGNVIGVAFDADGGTITFYVNGVSQGQAFSGITSGPYFPMVGNYNTTTAINFGQRPFSYTPPTGYSALNTYNLPAATIKNGAQYMAATTYTGTGSALTVSNAVNGVGFQPDFVWMKKRSAASSHYLQDSVRGSGVVFYSDQTAAENAIATGVTSFNSSGFSLGTNADVNGSGASQVAWNWKAGGTGVTNTSGTRTSTVSANTTAGFSIATYTGNGVAGATVGHGLGVAPNFIIVKNRGNAPTSWAVYHSSYPSASYYQFLDTTSAAAANNVVWNGTAPTSSVFSIGTDVVVNSNTNTYVAYCFAAVRGYSAFSSYSGNGSTDGRFVYTGFRPRYVMIKRTDTTGNWFVFDTSRDTYNVTINELYPNLSNAEAAGTTDLDILSNGFKLRASSAGINASGGTYIYAAFAENPFNYSRAR